VTANAGTALIPLRYNKNKITQIIGKKTISIKKENKKNQKLQLNIYQTNKFSINKGKQPLKPDLGPS
jgi:hypothetical protein